MGKANFAIEALVNSETAGLAGSPEWLAFAQAASDAPLDAAALKVIEAAGLCVDLTMQRQSAALDAAAVALLRARGLDAARQALFAGGGGQLDRRQTRLAHGAASRPYPRAAGRAG